MLQGCNGCSDQQALLCVQSCWKPPLMLNGCERCLSSSLSIHSCRSRPRGCRLRAHEQQSATLRALLNDFKGISDQLYPSVAWTAQISPTPTEAVKPTTRKRATEADERIRRDQISAQRANLLLEPDPRPKSDSIGSKQAHREKGKLGRRSKGKRVRMRREACREAELNGSGELTPSPEDREDLTAEAAQREKEWGRKKGGGQWKRRRKERMSGH